MIEDENTAQTEAVTENLAPASPEAEAQEQAAAPQETDEAASDAPEEGGASDEASSADEAAQEKAAARKALRLERLGALFGRDEGAVRFAKWSKPIVPCVFGLTDPDAERLRSGLEEAARTAKHEVAIEDDELGANLIVYVCDEWSQLLAAPGLDKLIPDLRAQLEKLAKLGANEHRAYHITKTDGLRAAIVLLRYDEEMARRSAHAIGLAQGAQALLAWSPEAFREKSPLYSRRGGRPRIAAEIAAVIEASYTQDVPCFSEDAAALEQIAENWPESISQFKRRGRGDRKRSSSRANEKANATQEASA